MSDVDDQAAQLEAEAAQAAQRAAQARAKVDGLRADQARERHERALAWQRERLGAIDRRALRAAVVDAYEELRQALQADPLGAALIRYLAAVMRERARAEEATNLQQVLGLAGQEVAGGVYPLDARGRMIPLLGEHALPLLAELLYAAGEAAVEQETARAADDREAYVSAGGRLDQTRRAMLEGVVSPARPAEQPAGVDVTGMTDAERERLGLPPASTRTKEDRARLLR